MSVCRFGVYSRVLWLALAVCSSPSSEASSLRVTLPVTHSPSLILISLPWLPRRSICVPQTLVVKTFWSNGRTHTHVSCVMCHVSYSCVLPPPHDPSNTMTSCKKKDKSDLEVRSASESGIRNPPRNLARENARRRLPGRVQKKTNSKKKNPNP